MANRSISTKFTGAGSTQASAVGVYATSSNTYTLTGGTLTTQFSVANTQLGAPRVGVSSTTLNGNVLTPFVTTVYYTDTNYNVLTANGNASLPNTVGAIRIIGTNFSSNARVYLQGNVANSTYINSTEIRVPIPATAAGTTNTLMVFNSNVSGVMYPTGIQWRSPPVWVSSSIRDAIINTNFSYTVSASDATTLTYSLVPGTVLPANTSFNTSTQTFSGNCPVAGVYPIGITATNIYNQAVTRTFTFNVINAYTVNYLLVAGGGGGGSSGGTNGTGASGGGGGVVTGVISVPISAPLVLTFTIGPSVPGGVNGSAGSAGQPSIISSPRITTITAVGGGQGAGQSPLTGPMAGFPGGSGGNSSFAPQPFGTGVQPSQNPGNPMVSAQYGFPGIAQANPDGTGGSGAGGQGTTPPPGVFGGGGAGITWPFTGTAQYGAGGNAPGQPSWQNLSTGPGGGVGGGGGGGTGAPRPPPANPGPGPGGSGGGGALILAVPSGYPGSAPGASVSNPPAAPGMTILTYSFPGTYTV
jgi:hypothetical protein